MPRYPLRLLPVVVLIASGYAQVAVNSQTPAPSANRHIDLPRAQPIAVPAPPDVVVPDGSVLRKPKEASALKRVAEKFVPFCVDMVFHTCWFAPLPETRAGMDDPKFLNNMEVGNFYLEKKNYRGAEWRFRDALELKPLDPEANFKPAVCLDRQASRDEARERYQAYLNLRPDGPFAAEATRALERLQPKLPAPEKPSKPVKPSDSRPKT